MPNDVYEADIVIWSEQQADLLRRAAQGERVNGLDWPNLIEEIESVGRSQINAVESLLQQALLHLLKCAGWPDCNAARHWRVETMGFLDDAARRVSPGMRQRIDLAVLYRKALRLAQAEWIDGSGPRDLPPVCPFTFDELLDDAMPLDQWIARLGIARPEASPEGDDA